MEEVTKKEKDLFNGIIKPQDARELELMTKLQELRNLPG